MTSLFRIFGANPTHRPPQPVEVRRRPWFETRAVLLMVLVCLLLTGCASTVSTTDREALSDTIGRAAVSGEQWAMVQDTIGSLRTHVDPVVQAVAEIVQRISERGKENTAALQKRVRDLGKQIDGLNTRMVKAENELADREDDIFGPRTWRWLFWIKVWVGIGLATAIASFIFVPGLWSTVLLWLGRKFAKKVVP